MKLNVAARTADAAHGSRRRVGGVATMRRYAERLLPVALLALLLQLLAPVGASWMAAAAAADPLVGVEICHSDAGPVAPGQGSDRDACGISCLLCCVLHAGSAIDMPGTAAVAAPWRQTIPVLWHDADLGLVLGKPGSGAQARGPPIPFLI
ncbi:MULTISPECIES: DUF2946 family protein [unclassified Bradyrhizobium]|uniref:DUF2946 family protein n=1 Tax=unclassified Bradyrhizobium TaxID=2631580 RepID=UPI0028E5C801|nr:MULTISPECIES: DUF2946 family protein [unclassified Bradyrhizobium]